ncbi:MAG TPA: chlorite dismutase family protein [Gemmatimonadaceae bacterium]|nr:chlorite dismutase family protein [Gemmatimonadaceae bacterium]
MSDRLYSFVGSGSGRWNIVQLTPVVGEPLPDAACVGVFNGPVAPLPEHSAWCLRGVTSNERYVTAAEHAQLTARQPALDRTEALCAALIPVRKTQAWWDLAQDDRRAIIEERSAHIKTGLNYLPAIARRLHHGRDLGEPFDFLTWFEYSPAHAGTFEELVTRLRSTEEWTYVDREIDIRLVRAAGT